MEAHGRDLSGTQGDCHGAVKDGGEVWVRDEVREPALDDGIPREAKFAPICEVRFRLRLRPTN